MEKEILYIVCVFLGIMAGFGIGFAVGVVRAIDEGWSQRK